MAYDSGRGYTSCKMFSSCGSCRLLATCSRFCIDHGIDIQEFKMANEFIEEDRKLWYYFSDYMGYYTDPGDRMAKFVHFVNSSSKEELDRYRMMACLQ